MRRSDVLAPSAAATADRRRHRRTHRALLTAAEERSLAQAIEAGREARRRLDSGDELDGDRELVAEGERARHHFIEANVRLVQSIANRFSLPVHLDREDIVRGAGDLGVDLNEHIEFVAGALRERAGVLGLEPETR